MWYENTNSMGIMKRKYLHEGEKPEDFIPRVASIFEGDLKRKAIEVLSNADFLPAGRTLFGAGYKGSRKVSLSNCFLAGTKVLTMQGFKKMLQSLNGYVAFGDGVRKLRLLGKTVNLFYPFTSL